MEQLVRDARHTDALTGIAECLGTGDEQDVVVCIVGYRWLIGCLERFAEVLAEVHGEVGKVFHDDDIILGGQFTDGLQFLFRHANPGRIVGVGVDDGADVALAEIALQLGT